MKIINLKICSIKNTTNKKKQVLVKTNKSCDKCHY